MFATVLRDGPPVGVHTVVWCDSVNNLNRTLDRQGLREFENRILFQMSANDSSTLIDLPAASKLGENRALYYSEEENRIEKFRPYGLPEAEWLEKVKARFAARPVPDVPAPANGASAAPAPVAMPEPVFGDGDEPARPTATAMAPPRRRQRPGDLDLDGPDRLVESHAPAPSGDEPGGPTIE